MSFDTTEGLLGPDIVVTTSNTFTLQPGTYDFTCVIPRVTELNEIYFQWKDITISSLIGSAGSTRGTGKATSYAAATKSIFVTTAFQVIITVGCSPLPQLTDVGNQLFPWVKIIKLN